MTTRHLPHVHTCAICGLHLTWCCRHRWTLAYIAVVVTLLLLSTVLELSR